MFGFAARGFAGEPRCIGGPKMIKIGHKLGERRISLKRMLVLAAIALAGFIVRPPLAAAGPPGHTVRLGILGVFGPSYDPTTHPATREFIEGLRELGYTPGRDIVFEYKSAGNAEALPQIAEELLRSRVDILLTVTVAPTLAAAKVTKTVPIVMVGATDVVETGLIANLARPGGNVTGLAIDAAEIAAKRVQLLRDAVPGLSRVAVLWNANIKGMALQFQNIEQASPQLGVILQSVRVTGSEDFDQAFAAIESSHPQGLVILYGPMRGNDLPRIVEFATQHKLPTIFEPERGVRAGGLMEFGPKLQPMSRRAAAYIDKIANGADPATLPVEEPTLFELVINLNAAKQMGIQIPNSLLLQADRVIE
jgi:putative ABC transport system substrate-binding protein